MINKRVQEVCTVGGVPQGTELEVLQPQCIVCGLIDLRSRPETSGRAGFWVNARAEFCYTCRIFDIGMLTHTHMLEQNKCFDFE